MAEESWIIILFGPVLLIVVWSYYGPLFSLDLQLQKVADVDVELYFVIVIIAFLAFDTYVVLCLHQHESPNLHWSYSFNSAQHQNFVRWTIKIESYSYQHVSYIKFNWNPGFEKQEKRKKKRKWLCYSTLLLSNSNSNCKSFRCFLLRSNVTSHMID